MQLQIRQRAFSWTDRYDVYDGQGQPRYEVWTEFLSLGHQIHVRDKITGREVGSIHEKILALLPRFEIVVQGRSLGTVKKEFSFLFPRYQVDYLDWQVEGDFCGWDYRVLQGSRTVMTISKGIFTWTDTYCLRYDDPADEIPGLLLVLAIDAANCDSKK